MLNETMINHIHGVLKRIFCQKVSRTTIREVQNGLMACTKGDRELSQDLFEALLSGQLQTGFASHPQAEGLRQIIAEFTIPLRVSKEVFERGEFVNMVTSDMLTNEGEVAFVNRVKRIDGEEFSFLTDPVSTIHLLHHFAARVQELEKNKDLLHSLKGDLVSLKDKIEALTR